ncbi:GNAT family N-acetyltransferase [Heyndrickxia sp. NPDC080065]|uniref:GNAT family N-acetyltransferase n=1 Tax=Heyndrickxia sp. NPDC080065 TaxID=3390568 RepID=UPI003D00607A
MIFQKDKIVVRKLQEKDKVLLVKWLSNPVVLQYYEGRDRPHNLEMVNQHFYNRKNREVIGCIVEYDGVEVGYIQYYPLDEETKKTYGYSGITETIYGTDQFIGEEEYWNQGIGKLLVTSMIEFLVNQKKADRVVMDPQAWNKRAIACYEKCNLKKVKYLPKHELHEGEYRDCWIMEYKK